MKQVLQNMKNGITSVEEVPVPVIKPGSALVQTAVSLVSAGTERMLVEFSGKNLIGKAAARPDLIRQVISKANREGTLPALQAAFNRLDQPMALGYSSSGTVIEVAPDLPGFKPGDRVACAGGGHAVHAEYGVIPRNLLVKIPDDLDFESAAFATLGAVAMQGFRLAQAQIGETVCVIGLGLLGLLTAQIARSAGCAVLGIDISADRVQLAETLGIHADLRENCLDVTGGFTSGIGFDIVLIAADTTSNDPIELAGLIARDRAKVIAIGAVGLQIPRKSYYEKELEFIVSRSYGPGRYDPGYEVEGIDYPVGYVRWTEGRNIEAFVHLLSAGKVNIKPMISHRFPIEKAADAYTLITGKSEEPYLGVVLEYPQAENKSVLSRKIELPDRKNSPVHQVRLGVLGAGNYAQAVFLPVIKKTARAELRCVTSASGLTARHAASKFGFKTACSSDEETILDPEINTVAILTRHHLHARQVLLALKNNKAVYCEKPLALNQAELDQIFELLGTQDAPLLTVGFNRRFAPFAIQLKNFFQDRAEPMLVNYRINAGFLPHTHWLHDPLQGGGRIIGEACHFIDLLTFLIGSSPVAVTGVSLDDSGKYHQDNVVLTFDYADGSIGTVTYLANGNKNFAKERVEVFCSGKIGILNDYRTLNLISETRKDTWRSRLTQDKGHSAAWREFLAAILEGRREHIPYADIYSSTRASFAAVEAIRSGNRVQI